MQVRFTFNLNIRVNMLEDLFIGDVMAFVVYLSKRTTTMKLITIGDEIQYRPYEVKRAHINGYLELFLVALDSPVLVKFDLYIKMDGA